MRKNKKYTFNTSAFKEFVDKKKTTPTTVSKAIGKANGYWGTKCYQGDSMEAISMCELCNVYGLSPLMFFLEEGQPMNEVYTSGETESVPEAEQNQSLPEPSLEGHGDIVRYYEQKMAQMQLTHKDELHKAEMEAIRKESALRDTIRRGMKDEMETDRIRIENRYEEKLSRKDEQITKLMAQLADLQAQYKELELAQRATGGFGYPIGVAETKADYQSK